MYEQVADVRSYCSCWRLPLGPNSRRKTPEIQDHQLERDPRRLWMSFFKLRTSKNYWRFQSVSWRHFDDLVWTDYRGRQVHPVRFGQQRKGGWDVKNAHGLEREQTKDSIDKGRSSRHRRGRRDLS